ncbi:MAG TPA: methionine--tRNA ligase subunit beta [Candidatus Nanoarchaeia archaeon]|nr:methionine--tRNA ligase subunit beta [Candidatus Nanoarchaeia archaeon]
MITLEEFQKTELTTGKIHDVQDHPQADKLYILQVDIGEKQLQLVAGIKPYYTKEELQGKTIILIKNLEPAELRGIKSEGMLLVAEKNGKVTLLGTDKPQEAGARIR